MNGSLQSLHQSYYWRTPAYTTTQLNDQSVLAIATWTGEELNVPIDEYASNVYSVGRSLSLLDRTLTALRSIPLPNGLDAIDMSDMIFNGKHILNLRDFYSRSIIDLDEGVKLSAVKEGIAL